MAHPLAESEKILLWVDPDHNRLFSVIELILCDARTTLCVETATTIANALLLLDSCQPNLVITELRLLTGGIQDPELAKFTLHNLGGIWFIQQIRKLAPKARILVWTSFSLAVVIDKAGKLGFNFFDLCVDAYSEKPNYPEVLNQVKQLL